MPETPKFQVIQGDWVSSPEWLDLPATIRMRAPNDRTRFQRVRVGRQDVIKAAENRRRQPAYDFWSVLGGKVPPVPGRPDGDSADLTTLTDAHACFKGINRPIAEDSAGGRTVAFVIKPKHFFQFTARPPLTFTTRRDVPADLVFVAYVRLDEPDGAGTNGLLTHWHFVEADDTDPLLPVNFDTRYLQRLW